MIQQVTKLQVVDPVTASQVNRLQDQQLKVLNPVLKTAILNGVAQLGLKFTASVPLYVNHGLARQPQGYFPTALSAAAIIYEDATQANPTLQLALIASADVTADLWVY